MQFTYQMSVFIYKMTSSKHNSGFKNYLKNNFMTKHLNFKQKLKAR